LSRCIRLRGSGCWRVCSSRCLSSCCNRRGRRGIGDDELGHRFTLLTTMELLLVILIFRRVADEEAIVCAGVEDGLYLRGNIPFTIALAGGSRSCGTAGGGLVVPGDAVLGPVGCDPQGLQCATARPRGRVDAQRRRLHDTAAGWAGWHVEAQKSAQVILRLGHDLEDRVCSLVARRAALVDPRIGIGLIRHRCDRAGRCSCRSIGWRDSCCRRNWCWSVCRRVSRCRGRSGWNWRGRLRSSGSGSGCGRHFFRQG
jgi:hypothetical protein